MMKISLRAVKHYEDDDNNVCLELIAPDRRTYFWPLIVFENKLGLIVFLQAAGLESVPGGDTELLINVEVTASIVSHWPVLQIDPAHVFIEPLMSLAAVKGLLWENANEKD